MSYDQERYQAKQSMLMGGAGGFAIAGTSAELEKFRVYCPKAMTVTGATWCSILGGTAAAMKVHIGKAIGGTGAVSSIGYVSLGTGASSLGGAITITETDFAAGDHLQLYVAGTGANEHLINVVVEWKEDFNTSD